MRHLITGLLLLTVSSGLWAQSGSPINDQYRDEIRQVTRDSRVVSAFALIEEDAGNARSELIELTEIPAPPFGERRRAKRMMEKFLRLSMDTVWIDEVGNVLALRRGRGGTRTVALDAHLDTVFPEGTDTRVDRRGDTLYAPGIADDTRGLAMLLSVGRAIRDVNIETEANLLFVASVGEEGLGDLRGVKYLFGEEGPNIDAWISIDGGGLGRISNQGLGSYRYRVTFHGPGGHSWGAFGMANPHHALGIAIANFDARAGQFTARGRRTSYNIGRIGGGTSVNSIPFESWMEVDMRSESPERLDSLDAIFKRSMYEALVTENELATLGDTLTVDLQMIGNRPSGELPGSTPLIQRAMACTAFMGKNPVLSRGSTNSNIPISLGIPAVTIGRGGKGANAHSLDEWWLDADGYKATQLAMLLLLTEAGLASK